MVSASDVALFFLILATSVSVLLALATIVRKVRRDRRTEASRVRRQLFASSLGDYLTNPAAHVAEHLERSLASELRSRGGRRDLIVFLDGLSPDDLAVMSEMATRSAAMPGLVKLARSRSAVARGTAILLLTLLRDEAALGFATSALNDADSDVRLVGVRALSVMPPTSGVPPLIAALHQGRLPSPRIVERLADTRATSMLVDELKMRFSVSDGTVEESRVGAGVTNALWLIGDTSAEPQLVRLLGLGSIEERIAAARALGTCGTASSVDALRKALRSDDAPVRMQAATALGSLRAHVAVDDLRQALADRSWWVRSNAATALGEMGEPGIVALQTAVSGPDEFAAHRASEELTFLGIAT